MRHDWDHLRSVFLSGGEDVTLALLSDEHGVPISSLRKVAKRERWEEIREARRARTKAVADVAERQLQVAQFMTSSALKRLSTIKVEDLTVAEFLQYCREGFSLERTALTMLERSEKSGS